MKITLSADLTQYDVDDLLDQDIRTIHEEEHKAQHIILAAATTHFSKENEGLAGMVLTGNLRPGSSVMKVIKGMPFPVLLAKKDAYEVASEVHDLIVKTRPNDTRKISLIRDLIATHVDVNKILKAL